MGIQRGGPFSGFVNKVGNLVGSTWRTLDVIKARPKISNKPKTQAQLDQQARFALATSILAPLADLIEVGFKGSSGVLTPMNAAVAENLKVAITGISPNFSFDYQKLQFSKGNLKNGRSMGISTVAGYKMRFDWQSDSKDSRERGSDLVSLLMYCPALDSWATLPNAAPRSAKTYTIQMPASFGGHEVMCFSSFVSTTIKNLASDTMYIETLVSN